MYYGRHRAMLGAVVALSLMPVAMTGIPDFGLPKGYSDGRTIWSGKTRNLGIRKAKPKRRVNRPPAPFFVALDDKDTGPVLHLKGKHKRAYWLAKSRELRAA